MAQSVEDKINLLLQKINAFIDQSKTIGSLTDIDPEANPDASYLGIFYNGSTYKQAMSDLIDYLKTKIGNDHVHEIEDINGLGEFITNLSVYTDHNGSKWNVIRQVANFDYTSLVLNDKIAGWLDESSKTYYVEGIVLNSNVIIPDEVYDNNKFFITNKKQKL